MNPPRTFVPCAAKTKSGGACTKARMLGREGCFSHSASPQELAAAGRRGNLVLQAAKASAAAAAAAPADLGEPDFSTADSTRAYLEQVSKAVVARKLAPSQAEAINRLAQTAVKRAELDVKKQIAELDTLAKRHGNEVHVILFNGRADHAKRTSVTP